MKMRNTFCHCKFMRFSAKIITVLMAVVLSGGIAFSAIQQAAPVEKRDSKVVGEELLKKLFSGYQNYFRPVFEDLVSQEFTPDRIALMKSIDGAFYSAKIIDSNFYLDKTTMAENKLAVGFHWEKKVFLRSTASEKMVKGKSEFVFVIEDNQWKLSQINQDNPFTKV